MAKTKRYHITCNYSYGIPIVELFPVHKNFANTSPYAWIKENGHATKP